MRKSSFAVTLTAMLAVAVAVRLNNVLAFPSLRGFDGFGHFTYIWFMAENWRVPDPTAGWSFFHPPLYYAFMAGVWNLLSGADPTLRLKAGTAAIALLGLIHALVSYLIVRRYLPENRVAQLLAPGLMLFLPVHLYTAGFLGNESLNAILCSISLLTLLWLLRDPSWRRAVVLGSCLGLAMLTKFTALAVVAGAFGTIGLKTVWTRQWRQGLGVIAITGVVMLTVCGWFYWRNLTEYGTPFQMSRDTFMVKRVENFQTRGKRGILEYILFDPVILRRPQWPRGIPIDGVLPPGVERSALRESVLTGVYANAWFDGTGGLIMPPVTHSEAARRSGQIILTLALVPSILVLVGIWTAIGRLRRRGWDDVLVAVLFVFSAMTVLLVYGTWAVPLHAAVKATYLTPVSVAFSFWLALGFDRLSAASRRLGRYAVMVCALLAVVCSTVFMLDRVVAPGWLARSLATQYPWQNLYGVVYYAGGDRDRARELFELSAQKNWHLAYENLATLALDSGRPLEALYRWRDAARFQPIQSSGVPKDKWLFDRLARAEYLNSMAVAYYELGWLEQAADAASQAIALDRSLPEAYYDLAVIELTEALSTADGDEQWRSALIVQANRHALTTLALDPAFFDAMELIATTQAMQGESDKAGETIQNARGPHPGMHRKYPIETGTGDMRSASIGRRRHITNLPDVLRSELTFLRNSGHKGASWRPVRLDPDSQRSQTQLPLTSGIGAGGSTSIGTRLLLGDRNDVVTGYASRGNYRS